MQKPSIIVKDLRVTIQDTTVLDGISFSLLPSQHLVIAGGSGSGKTSLAKALTGRIHFSGNISLQENDASHPVKTSLVEQRYSFKNLSGISDFYYQQRFNSFDAADAPTVVEELLKHLPSDEKESEKIERIEKQLRLLGIHYLKDAPLIQLSSGEHKRFQLIRALLNPPALLILDTPYAGLDVASRIGLNEILNDITREGTQLILIPGNFEIPDCITHVAFLENKKLLFFGEKENTDLLNFIDDKEPEDSFNMDMLPLSNENTYHGTVIEMVNVNISYASKSIINDINWTVRSGEKWLLKGRNGSGKSSLLNLVTGDHPQAYSNDISLFEKKRGTGESIWDIKQKIGYISPELHAYFDKDITVYKAIGSGFFDTIGLYKKLTSDQHKIILQWLDFLQISHVQHKPLHCISTSQQRLTLLARVLVKNPPLLILDEPCQGLDLHQRNQFISLIDRICEASEKTLIYVSHDDNEIPACIEKVFQLDQHKQNIYLKQKQAELETAL